MRYFLRTIAILVIWGTLLYLISIQIITPKIAHNAIYVLGNKLYTTPTNQKELIMRVNNLAQRIGTCSDHDTMDTIVGIQNFDDCYASHPLPLHIITHTLSLSADALMAGSSRPNESSGDIVTLFGAGYIQSRLFFLSEQPESWMISVHAKHDTPPPVILEVWLDDRLIGNLVYDKGDNSWETLSLSAQITPGFHNFRLWYVNDFFDPEQGLDRNAYIEHVHITP